MNSLPQPVHLRTKHLQPGSTQVLKDILILIHVLNMASAREVIHQLGKCLEAHFLNQIESAL